MITVTVDGENMRHLILALPLLTTACVYADTFEKLFDPAPNEHGQVYEPTPAEAEERRLQDLEVQRQAQARTQKFAAEQAKRDEDSRNAPPPHFDFVRPVAGRATFCHDPQATIILSEPDARERLGDINYVLVVTVGDCVEIGAGAVILCEKGTRLMWIRTGVFAKCGYVMTRDMIETGVPKGFRVWADEKPYDER